MVVLQVYISEVVNAFLKCYSFLPRLACDDCIQIKDGTLDRDRPHRRGNAGLCVLHEMF